MKSRLILASATVVMLSASAIAAEMPLKARPPAPPAPSWNGCYVGGNGGWVGAR
jgi:opacity protein-like surface antigen